MKEANLSISEAAKQLQVETHVLRYWEEELGIVIPRNEMGHRVYGKRELKLFYNIKELKQQGFQLRAIKLLIHDLENDEEFNLDKLVEMKEEINRRVEFLNEEGIEVEESLPDLIRKTLIQKQLSIPKDHKKDNIDFNYKDSSKSYRVGTQVREDLREYCANTYQNHKSTDSNKVTRLPIYQNAYSDERDKSLKEEKEGLPPKQVQQFQYIMLQILNQAFQEHTTRLSEQVASKVEQTIGDSVSDAVSIRMTKEMNYIARMQEEREEEYYQKLDGVIRSYQSISRKPSKRQLRKLERKDQKEAAAARENKR